MCVEKNRKKRKKRIVLKVLVNMIDFTVSLEALAMDNTRTGLIIFLFRDPHLLEGGQRGQDGTADPYGVLPFGRSNDLDFDGRRRKSGNLLLHTIGDTRIHRGTTGKDGISIEILADIDVALHDGVVDGLVDTTRLHTQEGRLEKSFGTTEPLITDSDDLTVGQLIALLEGGAGGSGSHFLFEVQGDVAELLLDVADNFSFSRSGEAVASLGEDFHEVIGKIATG